MATQFIAVEVLDPVEGLTNIYIPTDADSALVRAAIRAYDDDGVRPTGVSSVVEKDLDGTLTRSEREEPTPLFVEGWRTRSAFLR